MVNREYGRRRFGRRVCTRGQRNGPPKAWKTRIWPTRISHTGQRTQTNYHTRNSGCKVSIHLVRMTECAVDGPKAAITEWFMQPWLYCASCMSSDIVCSFCLCRCRTLSFCVLRFLSLINIDYREDVYALSWCSVVCTDYCRIQNAVKTTQHSQRPAVSKNNRKVAITAHWTTP